VARPVARAGLGRSGARGGRQLAEPREVHEPLDDVRLRGETVPGAPAAQALDEPVAKRSGWVVSSAAAVR
jgi:hypothetical protein